MGRWNHWSGMMGTASVNNVPPGAGPTVDREHDENGTRCAADRDVGRIQRSQGRRWFSLTRWLRELSAVAIRCIVVGVFDSEVRGRPQRRNVRRRRWRPILRQRIRSCSCQERSLAMRLGGEHEDDAAATAMHRPLRRVERPTSGA